MNSKIVTNYSKTFLGMNVSENVYRCLSQSGHALMELKYAKSVLNPDSGIVVVCSTSLHEHDFGLNAENGKPLRFEILLTGLSQDKEFECALPAIVRQMLSEGIRPGVGVVIQNADALRGYDSDMRHIVLAEPGKNIPNSTMHSDSMTIQWLRAIPVSAKELLYMNENGLPALIERLGKNREIADFARDSVI